MRFKLDENLPRELAEDIKNHGHDADTVVEEGLKGADDTTVIQAANSSGRILLTLDKGIPALLRNPSYQHAGIVLSRPDSLGRMAVASFVRSRLAVLVEMNLAGRLTVVTATRVRSR